MRRRLFVLYLAVCAALLAIEVRVFHLQVVSHERWVAEAAAYRSQEHTVAGPRGRIVDADGAALAEDRATVRLAFVPGEWASRERFRCGACGAVSFRASPRWYGGPADRPATPPRRCSCGAARERFERLPEEDLAPLEDALGVPSGTLSHAADETMRDVGDEIELTVVSQVVGVRMATLRTKRRQLEDETGRPWSGAEVASRWRDELEGREFYVEDARQQARADLYGRPVAFERFEVPSGGTLVLKSIPAEAERLLELDRDGRYRGLRTEAVVQRSYPRRGLLAHAVGVVTPFRDRAERDAYEAEFGKGSALPQTRVGRTGLEGAYEEALRGRPGRLRSERDADGLFTVRTVVQAPRRGADVVTHLRADACEHAYRALLSAATADGYGGHGPPSGAFFAMDPDTGAVLAMAETPTFDPNVSLSEVTQRIDEDEDTLAQGEAWYEASKAETALRPLQRPSVALSRVSRIAVEPGSAMKIVTVLALLESGHPVPEEYACAGESRAVEPKYPKCHTHGLVGPEGVLAYSCNRWCADCASDRAWRGLHTTLFPAWAQRFGLAARSGLDVVGEGRGVYPKAPDGILLRQLSIGQSMGATPVQMARVASAVQNGGWLPVPHIAATVGGRPVEPERVPIALDPGALARVRTGMRGCVTYGTAKHIFERPELAGVVVVGKTGTATATGLDWVEPTDKDPSDGPWHLWFVGYAEKPGARPVAFAVVLHARTRGVGGDEAAPVVAAFLSWWFAS